MRGVTGVQETPQSTIRSADLGAEQAYGTATPLRAQRSSMIFETSEFAESNARAERELSERARFATSMMQSPRAMPIQNVEFQSPQEIGWRAGTNAFAPTNFRISAAAHEYERPPTRNNVFAPDADTIFGVCRQPNDAGFRAPAMPGQRVAMSPNSASPFQNQYGPDPGCVLTNAARQPALHDATGHVHSGTNPWSNANSFAAIDAGSHRPGGRIAAAGNAQSPLLNVPNPCAAAAAAAAAVNCAAIAAANANYASFAERTTKVVDIQEYRNMCDGAQAAEQLACAVNAADKQIA
jgi:hypothetical protein